MTKYRSSNEFSNSGEVEDCVMAAAGWPKAAFTLAEVLITLGIIGIVAAMTIPTLTQAYRKKAVEAKLLKVYSAMNNAIKLSTIQNGPTETWEQLGQSGAATATYSEVLEWYNIYLADYIKSSAIKQLDNKEDLVIYFADGSALVIANFIYDMKYYPYAEKIGNSKAQRGKDVFFFRFSPKLAINQEATDAALKYIVNPGIEPYAYAWDGTFEGAKYSTINSSYGCYESTGALCTKLIQLNGWKIPDDYPYKF